MKTIIKEEITRVQDMDGRKGTVQKVNYDFDEIEVLWEDGKKSWVFIDEVTVLDKLLGKKGA